MSLDNLFSYPILFILWACSFLAFYLVSAELVTSFSFYPYWVRNIEQYLEFRPAKHRPAWTKRILAWAACLVLYAAASRLLPKETPTLQVARGLGVVGVLYYVFQEMVYVRLLRSKLVTLAVGLFAFTALSFLHPAWLRDSLVSCLLCVPVLHVCRGIKASILVTLLSAFFVQDLLNLYGPTWFHGPTTSLYLLPLPVDALRGGHPVFLSWGDLLMGAVLCQLATLIARKREWFPYCLANMGVTLGLTVGGMALSVRPGAATLGIFMFAGWGLGLSCAHLCYHIYKPLSDHLIKRRRADTLVLNPLSPFSYPDMHVGENGREDDE